MANNKDAAYLKFAINKKSLKECDNELFILSDDEKSLFIVNEIGAKIIELADGKSTLPEIKRLLADEYCVDSEKLEADVDVFLKEMQAFGYLE